MIQPPESRFCIKCGTALLTRQDEGQGRQYCPACGWVYYPKANQASAVAILQDGEVLLARRKFEPFQGQWTMPSGFLEYGESPEEAALREMQEELGVQVELLDLVSVEMERGDPRGLCLLVVYTGQIVSGEPEPGDDASELKRFPLNQLPEEIAFSAHRRALEKLIHPPSVATPSPSS